MARTLLLAACLWLALPAAASPAASPTETIHTTVDRVIAILKRPDLDRAERRRRVVAVVRPQFDFTAMARATLALYWRRATPAQRRAFVERLTRLLEATYIGRIDEYHDEEVVYDGERIVRDRALVKTHIVSGGQEIPVHYKLHRVEGQWLVYDVVIEEVSLVRNYRTTFREIARKEGIDGLLARMEEKIRALESGAAAKPEGKS